MTPKEKSEELVRKYQSLYVTVQGCNDGGNPCIITNNMFSNAAIRCAKLAIDEILLLCWNGNKVAKDYWQEVKQEIEKL